MCCQPTVSDIVLVHGFVRDALVITFYTYPAHTPYTSKWHPIEHRLFSQVERTWRGVILDSPKTALETVQRTRTQTGLTVRARLLDTVYELARKCSDTFNDIKDRFIRHDEILGKWKYVVDANGFT